MNQWMLSVCMNGNIVVSQLAALRTKEAHSGSCADNQNFQE